MKQIMPEIQIDSVVEWLDVGDLGQVNGEVKVLDRQGNLLMVTFFDLAKSFDSEEEEVMGLRLTDEGLGLALVGSATKACDIPVAVRVK